MSDIDSFIGSIKASIEALTTAASVAEEADIPEEDRATLERTRETLQAMSDRMYDLAMERGLTRRVDTMHLELKDRDQGEGDE